MEKARRNWVKNRNLEKFEEDVPEIVYYNTASSYIRHSVPSPPFPSFSLPHPIPQAETLKVPSAFLNTSHLHFVPPFDAPPQKHINGFHCLQSQFEDKKTCYV